jgi:two-component system sensor histidine kinase HupT/HoxJ
MSEAVLSRVFEPFFTTKEVGQGTGLGLALTYGIIQDHSGQIRAENHPQGGAVFTVELPTDKLVIK